MYLLYKKKKNKYYREYENKKRNPMTSEKKMFNKLKNYFYWKSARSLLSSVTALMHKTGWTEHEF